MTLVIRGLAINQIQSSGFRPLLRKELLVWVVERHWGLVVGLFAAAMYREVNLGLVMSGAVMLDLMVAAIFLM